MFPDVEELRCRQFRQVKIWRLCSICHVFLFPAALEKGKPLINFYFVRQRLWLSPSPRAPQLLNQRLALQCLRGPPGVAVILSADRWRSQETQGCTSTDVLYHSLLGVVALHINMMSVVMNIAYIVYYKKNASFNYVHIFNSFTYTEFVKSY